MSLAQYKTHIIWGVLTVILLMALIFQLSYYLILKEEAPKEIAVKADEPHDKEHKDEENHEDSHQEDIHHDEIKGAHKDGHKDEQHENIGEYTNGHKDTPKEEAKEETQDGPALPADAPQISIIITELGVNRQATEKAISLPKQVGLSFSPYSTESLSASLMAGDDGHQVFVEIPFANEQIPNSREQKFSLSAENKDFKNRKIFEAALSKVYEPNGVIMASSTFGNLPGAAEISEDLAEKKLVTIINTGLKPEFKKISQKFQLKFRPSSMVIGGSSVDAASIQEELKKLEEIATEQGKILVFVKPYISVLDEIEKWQEELAEKGFRLTPAI